MPRLPRSSTLSRANRARLLLKGGVSREDSDDELGDEDHPWLWTWDNGVDEQEGNNAAAALNGAHNEAREITSARMGAFQCRVGDAVLLKADGPSKAWVGIIVRFLEDDDGDRAAELLWFSQEDEIRNKEKKRTDFYDNELYITPTMDINKLTTINGSATVVSEEEFLRRYPDGKVPKKHNKTFMCRRGCNTRTVTYTDEFDWSDIYRGAENIDGLLDIIRRETKSKKRKRSEYAVDKKFIVDDDDDEGVPRTPKKKRKITDVSTPHSERTKLTPSKYTTPTHKRIAIKKPLEFTPLGTRILSPASVAGSPFQVARARLHVSSVPEALPCREEQFADVYSRLESAISEGTGSCIYISGTPGTGKTATVREVVAQLHASVQAEELDDFVFVEINGMKVTDPHQSYSLLWEALKGDRVSPSHALALLEREFSTPSPRRVPICVLMDELDQLVTKNQNVMYNFFNWPALRHSRLIVLAVANTMDLPERLLSNKISSRLGLTRITFPGYTHEQLKKIIQSRLEGIPGNIVDKEAIEFASRKVAAVSGDARRCLDICRRAVEMAEAQARSAGDDDSTPLTPSKRAKNQQLIPQKKTRVKIATIQAAINEATTSPLQTYLRHLPLAAKLVLAALLKEFRHSGLTETTLGSTIDRATQLGKLAKCLDIQNFLTGRMRIESDRKVSLQYARPAAIGAGILALVEGGVVVVEARKGERTAKIRLGVSDEEIKLALSKDEEVGDLGFAG